VKGLNGNVCLEWNWFGRLRFSETVCSGEMRPRWCAVGVLTKGAQIILPQCLFLDEIAPGLEKEKCWVSECVSVEGEMRAQERKGGVRKPWEEERKSSDCVQVVQGRYQLRAAHPKPRPN